MQTTPLPMPRKTLHFPRFPHSLQFTSEIIRECSTRVLLGGSTSLSTLSTLGTTPSTSRPLTPPGSASVSLTIGIPLLPASRTLTWLERPSTRVKARSGTVVLALRTSTPTACSSATARSSSAAAWDAALSCTSSACAPTAKLRDAAARLRNAGLARDAGLASAGHDAFQCSGTSAVAATGLLLCRLLCRSSLTLICSARRGSTTRSLSKWIRCRDRGSTQATRLEVRLCGRRTVSLSGCRGLLT
jgi:hypothetical protein